MIGDNIRKASVVVGEFFLGLLFFALIAAMITAGAVLISPVVEEPRGLERCFERPINGTVYTRRQKEWGPGQGEPCATDSP